MNRIAIFIDGQNFFKMQRDRLHWTIDLSLFKAYFSQMGEIVDAYYYTSVKYPITEKQQRFLDILPTSGYAAVTKPLKGQGDHFKGNMDVEIVLDMFNTIDTYDMAVLVSGDGDFERALSSLRSRGKKFLVVSTDGVVAREIRLVAGQHYIDVATIKEYIFMQDTRQYSASAIVASFLDDFPPEAENI